MAQINQAEGRAMLLWLTQRIALSPDEENAVATLVQRLNQDNVKIAQAATFIKLRRVTFPQYLNLILQGVDAYLMGTGLDQVKAWSLCKETAKTNPEILPESLRGGY